MISWRGKRSFLIQPLRCIKFSFGPSFAIVVFIVGRTVPYAIIEDGDQGNCDDKSAPIGTFAGEALEGGVNTGAVEVHRL